MHSVPECSSRELISTRFYETVRLQEVMKLRAMMPKHVVANLKHNLYNTWWSFNKVFPSLILENTYFGDLLFAHEISLRTKNILTNNQLTQ